MSDAAEYLEKSCKLVDLNLDALIPAETEMPETLHKAMRYSLFAGGKRLRPALAFAAAEAVGGCMEEAIPVACAIEMIHTYSLIHDDLPAMDNDDLRRGRPTCHKVFGDAIAILAGDALLTLAFEILTGCERKDALAGIIKVVAKGVGTFGMVGGQVLDMEGEGRDVTLEDVKKIHEWKTAALITASCEGGALSGGATLNSHKVISDFGKKIGLAFQILDDILDVTSSPEMLGKTPGKDVEAGKATYPSVVGLEKAKQDANSLMESALNDLKEFGAQGQHMEALAKFVVERKS